MKKLTDPSMLGWLRASTTWEICCEHKVSTPKPSRFSSVHSAFAKENLAKVTLPLPLLLTTSATFTGDRDNTARLSHSCSDHLKSARRLSDPSIPVLPLASTAWEIYTDCNET